MNRPPFTGAARGHHAIERARERYGVDLSAGDLEALGRRLAAGEGVLLCRLPEGKERRLIALGEVDLIVVWAPVARAIVTCLPKRKRLPVLWRPRGLTGKKGEGRKPRGTGEE